MTKENITAQIETKRPRPTGEFVTTKELSVYLRISQQKVRDLATTGVIPMSILGPKSIRYRLVDVEAAILAAKPVA